MRIQLIIFFMAALCIMGIEVRSQNILQQVAGYFDEYVLSSYDSGYDDILPQAIIDFNLKEYFPPEARKCNITEYKVILLVYVDENGKCVKAEIKSGDEPYGFNDSALKVVKRMRFTPGRRNGSRVKMKFYLPVTFILN